MVKKIQLKKIMKIIVNKDKKHERKTCEFISQDFMIARFPKNVILILAGMVIGAWAITKDTLSKLDWAIIIIAIFVFIWDIYLWYIAFRRDKK